jgi:hypothetical protein
MKKTLTREDAGPSAEDKTMEAAKAEFMSRWIPWGIRLLYRTEAHGIPWRSIPLEDLRALVIEAENFATPEEYAK